MGTQCTRRGLIRLAGTAIGAAALTACGATATPQVVEKVVEKEVTRLVEGTPQIVTETVVVEKEVTVPAATAGERAHIIAIITGDGQRLQESLVAFGEAHPDVDVDVMGVAWDGYDEKVDLLIAGGNPPALWFPAAKRGYRYYADKGMFPDLGPFIERDGYDVADFYQVLYDFVQWEGKQRGFPTNHNLCFIFYNKSLIEAAGVDVPPADWADASWTWDRFLEIALAVAKLDADPLKAVWGCGDPYDTRFAAWGFGGDYFRDEDYVTGKPTSTIVNSPEVVDALQFRQDLIYKHKVQPTPAEGQIISAAGVNLFLSGKVGMVHSATWSLSTYGEIEEFEWGIAPIPNSPTGRKAVLYPNQWMMFKDQRYPEAAWEVLKYIVSVDGMRAMLFDPYAGSIPSRSSLATEWYQAASEVAGLSGATLDAVVADGVAKYGRIAPSHAVIRFAEVYDVAIQPQLDNLLLNKITAQEAVATMEPKINEILSS